MKGSWWKCSNIVDPQKMFWDIPKRWGDNHERTSFKGYLARPMSMSNIYIYYIYNIYNIYIYIYIMLCFLVMGIANLDGHQNMKWAKPYAEGVSPQRYLLITIHIYIYIIIYLIILYIIDNLNHPYSDLIPIIIHRLWGCVHPSFPAQAFEATSSCTSARLPWYFTKRSLD